MYIVASDNRQISISSCSTVSPVTLYAEDAFKIRQKARKSHENTQILA